MGDWEVWAIFHISVKQFNNVVIKYVRFTVFTWACDKYSIYLPLMVSQVLFF